MPRYRQQDYIGSGAYGSVYGCCEVDEHNVELQDGLAIKYLKDEWLDDEEARERFRREARFLRQLKHPNILPVIYSNLSADRPYIVTPRADSNLGDALKHNRASDRDWALGVFRALLSAVAYAHEQHVLHRDLKPDNVLFLGTELAVSDFGMGKNVAPDASGQTLTNRAIGTPLYMAPEMWTDAAHATKAADVFSLGKMLWELVTNRPPQPWGVDLDAIDDSPLRDYIARCCDQEPILRFRDASEALRAWDTLVGGLAPARSPFETAESLVNEWRGLPQGPDIKALRRLDELLDRQRDEEQLYYDLVPICPRGWSSSTPRSYLTPSPSWSGATPGTSPASSRTTTAMRPPSSMHLRSTAARTTSYGALCWRSCSS